MLHDMRIFFLVACMFFLFTIMPARAFKHRGEVKDWTSSDFLGFDPVGDCRGSKGDITSVYARVEEETLFLRVTFDDMVTRVENKVVADHFKDKNIFLRLDIRTKSNREPVLGDFLNLQCLRYISDQIFVLRTPGSNLFEARIHLPGRFKREDLAFSLAVLLDNVAVDSFEADGEGSKDQGNCAFVHHGNQGLTYTNVFYGNPNGISGLDGSGYDEVLQVHEATGIPGNFHLSGTLMPAAQWHNPEFNTWLKNLAAQGIVSMMTSALGQHIMPFVQNSMNEWSVGVESDMVNALYNYTPRIAWVPERVWGAPGYYPDAGVIDWPGDNWTQHGVWGVVLDDWPHLNGYDNRKIHSMNNGSGILLRVIPINNTFVGNMHYDAQAAKNQIASMGPYNLCVYGTDWEAAAEMNEHDGTWFLDNYENVLWYCHDNYPGVNVWKLEDAVMNPNFSGTGADLTNGTYGLLGGTGGYGGSNNSWYTNWAGTPSRSDFHDPKWNYGYTWWNAFSCLMGVTDNSLAQLAWYTLMINLHETGWHSGGQIADWEHRYSSHIKNANVYTEASRWADNQYAVTTACYFDDIDQDGTQELVVHNDKLFAVIESIGGKVNWLFYKNGYGQAFSVVSSDMAYWSETEGDYNESSNNHVAALSDVSPNQQNAVYAITINQVFGDTVSATLTQWGVSKTITLMTGRDYLEVLYDFSDQTGYVKSGWSPDLLDIIWSGKNNLQRAWGAWGSYCGYRNASSGATAALVLGNGGASHQGEFEGTLVKGDEIRGQGHFKTLLFAGYTSPGTGTSVPELDYLAAQNLDVFPPELYSPAVLVADNKVLLSFSEALDEASAEDISHYTLENFGNPYTLVSAERQPDWSGVVLTTATAFIPGDEGQVVVTNVKDLNNNLISGQNIADLSIPDGFTPHAIIIDGTNDFTQHELIGTQAHTLYITWDAANLYAGFYSLDLNGGGDLFINLDTDQIPGSGATTGSWGREDFAGNYLPEYQVAIEGGGGSMQVNHWTGTQWYYPGNGAIGSSYEGWSGNGFTEISIPWSALGNPAGIALSVGLTQEDNHMMTEIFPHLNPTGHHPTLTHVYAFFYPFIPAAMPLSGFQPGMVTMVPNTGPQIIAWSPPLSQITMEPGASQLFTVTATDAQGDDIFYSWSLDGIPAGTNSQFTYSPGTVSIGTHALSVTISDQVPGNLPDTLSWSIEVAANAFYLDLRVNLEGPFNGLDMNVSLNEADLLPLAQPYHLPPWNYSGTESVMGIPGSEIVDWVLLELRDAPTAALATPSTRVAQRACFLFFDGSIVDVDGYSPPHFALDIADSLFVVVWHRDHLAVMSAVGLQESGDAFVYDFTTDAGKAFGGMNGHKELVTGVWGMISGDGNADGQVNNADKNDVWNQQAGSSGYLSGDFNMNGQVDNTDKIEKWKPNTGRASQVPD